MNIKRPLSLAEFAQESGGELADRVDRHTSNAMLRRMMFLKLRIEMGTRYMALKAEKLIGWAVLSWSQMLPTGCSMSITALNQLGTATVRCCCS